MKKKLIILSVLVLIFIPFIGLAQIFPPVADPIPPAPTPLPPPTPAPIPTPGPSSILCRLATGPNIQQVLSYVTCLISRGVIPLIFTLAVVSFVWGVVQYVINADEEAKKEKGRQFMVWGIIALTVMVSVWGLVKILGTTFGIEFVIPQTRVQR